MDISVEERKIKLKENTYFRNLREKGQLLAGVDGFFLSVISFCAVDLCRIFKYLRLKNICIVIRKFT